MSIPPLRRVRARGPDGWTPDRTPGLPPGPKPASRPARTPPLESLIKFLWDIRPAILDIKTMTEADRQRAYATMRDNPETERTLAQWIALFEDQVDVSGDIIEMRMNIRGKISPERYRLVRLLARYAEILSEFLCGYDEYWGSRVDLQP